MKKFDYRTKQFLGRVLSAEKLNVVFSSDISTAAFNPFDRIMYLPKWEHVDANVYNMFIAHEVGHAIWTPGTKDTKKYFDDPLLKVCINIVEDIRINKKILKKYKGLRKDFHTAMKDLTDDGFMGDLSDLTQFGFLDRINIHYKLDEFIQINVPFSDKERPLFEECDTCETFEDVVEVSKKLVEHAKTEQQKTMVGELRLGDGEGKPSEDQIPKDLQSVIEEKIAKYLSEKLNIDLSEEHKKNTLEHCREENRRGKYSDSLIADLPLVDSKKYIVPFLNYQRVLTNYYDEFEVNQKPVVGFLTADFLRKKKADEYRRTVIKDTGIIDTNRLYRYKFDEKVFLSNGCVSGDVSHGFVMFLDLSGSMSKILSETIQQLMTLVLFCRRVGIKFEVYGFRTTYNTTRTLEKTSFISSISPAKTTEILDLFSSESKLDKIKSVASLLLSGDVSLTSTPLFGMMQVSFDVIKKFRERTKVQKCFFIVLSDGEDTEGVVSNNNQHVGFATAHHNGHVFQNEEPEDTFLEIIKTQYGCKTICFFLDKTQNSFNHLKRISDRCYRKVDTKYDAYYIVTDLNLGKEVNCEKIWSDRVFLSNFINEIS